MKNAYRVAVIGLLAFALLALSSSSWAQTRPPIVEQMAKTYGIDSWGQIEAIRYTFNLEIAALNLKLAHTWEWEPKTCTLRSYRMLCRSLMVCPDVQNLAKNYDRVVRGWRDSP